MWLSFGRLLPNIGQIFIPTSGHTACLLACLSPHTITSVFSSWPHTPMTLGPSCNDVTFMNVGMYAFIYGCKYVFVYVRTYVCLGATLPNDSGKKMSCDCYSKISIQQLGKGGKITAWYPPQGFKLMTSQIRASFHNHYTKAPTSKYFY